ncbi:MAG: HlyD family efflux transporter periplasmic adaptor subunit [Proteobacteria bacterium]|nr:HlyD family efflux transporter periplasmic adaptor subunit [Pseudomonadota bacterium]
MPNISRNRAFVIAAAAAVLVVLAWLAWPDPVPVDLAPASRMSMEVTVDEEARTRVHHVYTVSAPLTGTVLRPEREVGDPVTANQTVVAVMKPTAPSFHDPRLHQELMSALSAADAAVTLAEAERRRIEATVNLSNIQLRRMQTLAGEGAVARSALDRAVADAQTNQAALASATAELQVRRNERDGAAVRLQNPTDSVATSSDPGCCIQIRAPVTGDVLKLIQESEAVVLAGTPLIEIGNPQDLEIVAELLSTDAVQVRQGQSVHIDGWGGPPIQGRVRRIEPAGFLKVSALGIEEQRVRTIIDFTDPPQRWRTLGHDYRVIVHVVIWRRNNVLTVPVGALFRVNDKWAVFRDEDGRARSAIIVMGHRNNRVAEVLFGLTQGDQVVLHASDRVSDGARIAQRD